MLKITLFGTPKIMLNDQCLSDLITGRRLALFLYLVANSRPHARDLLADLLWSNTPNRKARKHLRDALPTLRRYLSEYLIAGPDTVAFNRESDYWLDVEVFRSYVAQGTTCNPTCLHEVLSLYKDDFLDGFHIFRAPVFSEWVLQQRKQLQKLVVKGLYVLANHYLAQDDYAAGLLITKRLLTLEPWREHAHRLQMYLLARSGQRSAALEQYATCQHILAEEYGIDPLPETTFLYSEIKSGQLATTLDINRLNFVDHAHHTTQVPYSINLDAIPSSVPLYGREQQLAQLKKWVRMGCRLITLFGIAGQGKTALMAKLVHDWADSAEQFECILWYSLASQPTVDQVMDFFFRHLLPPGSRLPDALAEQFALLLNALRRQRCLLVLDHVEQIMSSEAGHGEMYNELWRWLAQNKHQSCLILVSRTLPEELSALEEHNDAVRSLLLRGLSVKAGVKMLSQSNSSTDESVLSALVDSYSGHPLALTLLKEALLDLSDDQRAFFFKDGGIFEELRDLLAFDQFSPAERDLLIWLAILGKPIDFKSLWPQLVQPYPKLVYFSAQRALQRQGLLFRQLGNSSDKMGLQKIVQRCVTEQLVETITQEIVSHQQQALGLVWLKNALSLSDATTTVDKQQMTFSMLQQVNPNDLEQWLIEQGSGLTYLNRYLLGLPLQQAVLSRLAAKWGRDGCAKQLADLRCKLQRHRSEVGYAQTNLRHLRTHQPTNPPAHEPTSPRTH